MKLDRANSVDGGGGAAQVDGVDGGLEGRVGCERVAVFGYATTVKRGISDSEGSRLVRSAYWTLERLQKNQSGLRWSSGEVIVFTSRERCVECAFEGASG